MIEKIVEISSEGLYLHGDHGFLEIKKKDLSLKKIPVADISTVLFSGFGQTISTSVIDKLLENGVLIVFCKSGYFPSSYIWPYHPHTYHHKRVHAQTNLTQPFKKNIWKNIVQAKITHQGQVLNKFKQDDDGLIKFSENVKSGDLENHEAQAARRYWRKLFGSDFTRDDSSLFINSFLNYGYAILRSSVARSICSAGLSPLFGVGHNNSENPFCLVDDFIEPYRPVIDQIAYRLFYELEEEELNTTTKKILIAVLNETILHDGQMTTISHSILKLCSSYVKAMETATAQLSLPDKIILNEK